MNNTDLKNLCLQLIHADTEAEVISLLRKTGFWDNSDCWRYYGDYENNYNTIGNQQSRPEAALVEKIVNSVDARLVNECTANGIDPEGRDAPKTIREAVAQFFDTNANPKSSTAGLISMWPNVLRTEVAKGITLSATGNMPSEGYPCFTISDCGEGQTPEMFPSTFLSTTGSNKLRIPFVQGKFNMGGTGVLKFCGKNNLQLIVSRRNPNILDTKHLHESDNQWGFTIVRRENPTGGRRNSVFTYLAPVGAAKTPGKGGVLRFTANSLPIFPEGQDPYCRKSEWGTLIKLYEYEVTGFKTHILRKGGLLSRIDLLLPYLALPVRLHECRKNYRGHKGSFDTNLTGIGTRLEDDKADNLEFEPSSSEIRVTGQTMNATIFAFKKEKSDTYRKNEGIIFVVNGQTHGHFTTDFFRRKNVGMSYLADSLLVIVDCSKIDGRDREDLFMNSRDRLSGGDFREEIERRLEDLLKTHDGLRALRQERRREEIESKVAEDKPLEDILDSLLKNSPDLANFLLKGTRLHNPFKATLVDDVEKEFQGKRYPTYFKIKNVDYGKTLFRECHINMRSRILFETDAIDDYFSRQVDPGYFSLYIEAGNSKAQVEDYVVNLYHGKATLNLQLPPNCRLDDVIHFVAEVSDNTQLKPFVNHFKIRVKSEQLSNVGGQRRGGSPGLKPGTEREIPEGLSLPNIIRIRRDEWNKQSPPFDEYAALRIIHAGTELVNGREQDTYDFKINVDNIFLTTELKTTKAEPKLVQAKFIYGMVLLGLALLKQDIVENGAKNGTGISEEGGPSIEERVERFSSAAAMVILPIIDELSQLDLEDLEQVTGDGEAT